MTIDVLRTGTKSPPLSAVKASGGIDVLDVSKVYGTGKDARAALSGISLRIPRGSVTAVIGRSGCGKSTLLRLIAGLLQPSAGSIMVDGDEVDGPPPQARYVFQDYSESLFAWATVHDNVAFGAEHASLMQGDAAEVALRNLRRVGLVDVGQRYPWELSGGMQQRVAIARALASRPDVLLMDEPFGAVDALSRASLQDMIQKIWRELHFTLVFVTHDIDEAIYLADRVIVIEPSGAGILDDVAIDLPRPRSQIETRESAAFLRYRRRLLEQVLGVAEEVA